jgi:hypothetical protein
MISMRTWLAVSLTGLLAAWLVALIPATASASLRTGAASAATPFGLYETSNNDQYSFPVTPAYAIQYYGWREGFQTGDAQAAWNAGTEVFAELQTCGNPCDSTGISITNVTSGMYDTYLTDFADAVAGFGHPVMLTFDHEMNGAWYPWGDTEITPAQWIAAWQHVTALISSIAPNVTWVWAPNIEQGAASVSQYWPGIGYPNPHVNMVGVDGYFQNAGSNWANTFSRSVTDIEAASGGSYPLVVAETGVPSADPDNVSQIDNLVSGAQSAGATAVMYFDCGSKWSLTSSEQSEFVSDMRG